MRNEIKWAAVLLGCTMIWGATFPLMKLAMTFLDPIPFLAVRFSIGAAVLWLLFRRRVRASPRSIFFHGAVLGLSLYLAMVLQVFGLTMTSSTNSAFLSAIYIAVIPVYTALVKKTRLPPENVFAVTLVTIGMLFVCGAVEIDLSGGFPLVWSMTSFGLGDALTLACSFCFGLYITLSGEYSQKYDPFAITTVNMGFFALCAWMVFFIFPQGGIGYLGHPSLIAALFVTGVFGAALCYGGMITSQRYLNPVTVVVLLAGEPVFGALFAMIIPIDGQVERMSLSCLAGSAMILFAIMTGEVAGALRLSRSGGERD